MENRKIVAHRGLWKNKEEQNTPYALNKALDNKFSIELDLRDCLGEIVVSHDPPKDCKTLKFEELLDNLKNHENFYTIYYALNIKSDGIEHKILELVKKFKISEKCFVFDMSNPSKILFHRLKKKLKSKIMIATRISEVEKPILYEESEIIWMDEFEKDWIDEHKIKKHLDNNKLVVIVSPELHMLEFIKKWERYKPIFKKDLRILICTDHPEKLKEYMER